MTYAQRSARVLESAGFSAFVMRMPAGVSDQGCEYAVKVPEKDFVECVEYLKKTGFSPRRAYMLYEDGSHAALPI